MTLVGPWLSTTSTTKKSEKITKKKQEELERGWKERNVRLREMKLPKETFEQYLEWVYGKGSKTSVSTGTKTTASPLQLRKISTRADSALPSISSINGTSIEEVKVTKNKKWEAGSCSTKPSPVYTGTKMIGIAQMHKSNAVPVFSDEEVIDISKMRR